MLGEAHKSWAFGKDQVYLVFVLIGLMYDTRLIEPHDINLIFLDVSPYLLIRDFEKSQNKCKWFDIWFNFLL